MTDTSTTRALEQEVGEVDLATFAFQPLLTTAEAQDAIQLERDRTHTLAAVLLMATMTRPQLVEYMRQRLSDGDGMEASNLTACAQDYAASSRAVAEIAENVAARTMIALCEAAGLPFDTLTGGV